MDTHCLFSKQDALSTLKTLRSLREPKTRPVNRLPLPPKAGGFRFAQKP